MKMIYPATAMDHSNPLYNKNLIGNYIIKHFERQGVKVEIYGANEGIEKYYFKAKKLIIQKISGKNHLRHREPNLLKSLAGKISDRINHSDADFIFCFGTIPLAYLETDKPIFLISDATFRNLFNFYEEYSNLTNSTILNSDEIERLAFNKARKIFLPSEWAIQSAINDYNVPKEKLVRIPLGANIESEITEQEIFNSIANRKFDTLRLLIIGKYWLRKGGDIAVRINQEINRRGIKSILTVIGMIPENLQNYNNIEVIPFLDKSKKEDLAQFDRIFKDTHFLIHSARYEIFAHVILEANGFGVPVICSHTGGLSSIIQNNSNGFLVDFATNPMLAADIIIDSFQNQDNYHQLAMQSYARFKSEFNWELIISKIINIIRDNL